MKFKRLWALLLVISLTGLVSTQPSAQSDQKEIFMFIDQLKPGMRGVGKTIVKGDKIEKFMIHIVDIIDNPGELNDLILCRASGPPIEKSGGISAGMSGSPVYVDGKLIGAISQAATFDTAENPTAVITPIQSMLKLIDQVKEKVNIGSSNGPSEPDSDPVSRKVKGGEIFGPIWVSGMGDRAFYQLKMGISGDLLNQERKLLAYTHSATDFISMMKSGLQSRHPIQLRQLDSYEFGSEITDIQVNGSPINLEPGSSIGVLMAQGDITMGALGTLTYLDKDLVLAFGHSFMFTGSSQFFLTKAHILDTIKSLEFPFKYANFTETVGGIFEDRSQGVAGALGVQPESIDIKVHVKDLTKDNERDFFVQITGDPQLAPQLIYSILLQAVDTTLNRIGEGSLKIKYRIEGEGLPRDLKREDTFYSFEDIAPLGPIQVSQAAFLLIQNEFCAPRIQYIDVKMQVETAVNLVRIKSLQVDKEEYKAGDEVNYTVLLKPFRGQEMEVSGQVKIPEDIDRTSLNLRAFGGSKDGEDDKGAPEFENLEELIEAIESSSSNNYLTVQITGLSSDEKEKDEKVDQEATSLKKVGEKIITGEKTVQIKVKTDQDEKEEEKESEKCKFPFYCP